MRLAIAEARRALDHDDVPVGAVVIRDGDIIASRHNERAIVESPLADARSRVAQGEYLGVRGRITGEFTLVVSRGDDLAVADHDGSDRDIVVVEGASRLGDGEPHELLVLYPRLHGGEGGIRTHGRLPFTRFPSVPIRPLSHLSR